MLKLKSTVSEKIQAFMESFHADTFPNPFNPHERVWRSRVRLCLSAFHDHVWISSVESIEARKGHGSQCMDWLLDLVIEHGILIRGNAQPFGPKAMPQADLIQWYAFCGFNTDHSEIYFDGEE